MSVLPVAAMAVISGTAAITNPITRPEAGAKHNLRLVYENDAISGMDRDYTHGTRIEYMHAGFCDVPEVGYGFSLTQDIYTPKTHAAGAVPGEHPYAGYMGVGGILTCRDFSEGRGFVAEIQLGVIGEPSLAHGGQHLIHEMGGMETWKGWRDQVPSEVTLQAAELVAYRIRSLSGSAGGLEAETFFYGRGDVGTIRISGGAGLGFRIGHNLPQNSAQIIGNRAANIGLALATREQEDDGLSYYMVGNVSAEYVARDFAIDGGVFHHFDRTCGRTPWQAEGRLGAGVVHQGIEYFMGVTVHSRTYRTQDRNSVYGTFSVTWHW